MACDRDVLPLESRIAEAADEGELDDIYETERQLLYVACTRARDRLLVTGVALARVDGKATRLLAQLARIQLLIIDDWAMARLTAEQPRDLMEVIDDRHQRASTILATQIPIERWHDTIGDPTYADAILDRLVHNAYRIELRGDSMRRRKPDMPGDEKN